MKYITMSEKFPTAVVHNLESVSRKSDFESDTNKYFAILLVYK